MWVQKAMLQQKQKTHLDCQWEAETFKWQKATHQHGDPHWGYLLNFPTFYFYCLISVTAISLHIQGAGQDLIWGLHFLISEGNFSNLGVMR